jgi:hypothetical protein
MNAQLNYIVAQQRIADLQRAAERARLASDAGAVRRNSNQFIRLSAQLTRLTARLAAHRAMRSEVRGPNSPDTTQSST